MSAKSVCDALQDLHAQIAGVKTAPKQRPTSLNTADMPLVLIRPMAATWDTAAIGLRKVSRQYEVAVFVGPLAQGAGVDQVWQDALVLLDKFGELYTDPTLPATLGADLVKASTDNGLSGNMVWSGVNYQGFVYTVTVKEKTAT